MILECVKGHGHRHQPFDERLLQDNVASKKGNGTSTRYRKLPSCGYSYSYASKGANGWGGVGGVGRKGWSAPHTPLHSARGERNTVQETTVKCAS